MLVLSHRSWLISASEVTQELLRVILRKILVEERGP